MYNRSFHIIEQMNKHTVLKRQKHMIQVFSDAGARGGSLSRQVIMQDTDLTLVYGNKFDWKHKSLQ